MRRLHLPPHWVSNNEAQIKCPPSSHSSDFLTLKIAGYRASFPLWAPIFNPIKICSATLLITTALYNSILIYHSHHSEINFSSWHSDKFDSFLIAIDFYWLSEIWEVNQLCTTYCICIAVNIKYMCHSVLWLNNCDSC